jgi:hypothetical protein
MPRPGGTTHVTLLGDAVFGRGYAERQVLRAPGKTTLFARERS